MKSSEIKAYIGRAWGDLNVFVENVLEIENPAACELQEERERFTARKAQAEQIIAELVDVGQKLKAENERLLRVNEEGYQALAQALSQAKPDSIKNTVPVFILRALAGLAEREPETLIHLSSNRTPVSAAEMLELCKRNDDAAKIFLGDLIANAISLLTHRVTGHPDPSKTSEKA